MPKGAGNDVLLGLRDDHGIKTGNIKTARGSGQYNPLSLRGIGEQTEKEMLTVIVPEEKADEIFEYIYYRAHIDEPHNGIIFQSDLLYASKYELPEDIEKEQE